MPFRSTHTFAELEVSAAAYDEIAAALRAAAYNHAFVALESGTAIDMHGIGLTRKAAPDVSESFGVQPRSARLERELVEQYRGAGNSGRPMILEPDVEGDRRSIGVLAAHAPGCGIRRGELCDCEVYR